MFRTLTPIFSILVAVVVYFYFVQPKFEEIKTVQNETEEYREAIVKAEQLNQTISALVQKKDAFSTRDMERVEALVPKTLNEVALLVDLEEILQVNGMTLESVEITKDESDSEDRSGSGSEEGAQGIHFERDFRHSDISLGIIGTYEQMRSVIQDIEQSLVLMEIVSIDFTAGEGPLGEYKIVVRAFALRLSPQQ